MTKSLKKEQDLNLVKGLEEDPVVRDSRKKMKASRNKGPPSTHYIDPQISDTFNAELNGTTVSIIQKPMIALKPSKRSEDMLLKIINESGTQPDRPEVEEGKVGRTSVLHKQAHSSDRKLVDNSKQADSGLQIILDPL